MTTENVDLDEVLEPQASNPGTTITETSPMITQQITAFADQDAGWTTAIGSTYDDTMNVGRTAESDLGEFLNRPIRQSVQQWFVGQPLFYRFNPWQEFCENPFVAKKIDNYELLRMKLHCKIVISGTKFHYGRALVSYNPLKGQDVITIERNFVDQDLVAASQKPHFFLNPTKNSGGEITMPFFWVRNYLSISDEDYRDMGQITIKSFGNLLNANDGNDPVTVTIYLWAEDVVLTMPTAYVRPPPDASEILESQAGRKTNKKLSDKNAANDITGGDEYGTGIISKPANMVAKAAGKLGDMPAIGPYAIATQMIASGIGRFAQIFGYSRPNVITDTVIMKPSPTGNLANADAADAAMKLTLDSKCELSIDSRTVGLDGEDQMGIKDIAMRESYLTSFNWDPDIGPDSFLWNARVTPMQFAPLEDEIHPTPMAMLAEMFEYWQGSIKFRFQIIKSDFHKGRLLVRFDPNKNPLAVEYNTAFSRVVDIAEQDDFEIVVGWGQAEPWLKCGSMTDLVNFDAASRFLKEQFLTNGVLDVAVLNDLVCPSSDSPIRINVFVSMCEDAKFAAPTNRTMNNLHIFNNPLDSRQVLDSQSGMMDATENPGAITDRPLGGDSVQPIAEMCEVSDNTYKVFFGDPPTSLRELMKRYVFTKQWVPERAPKGILSAQVLLNKDAPYFSGYDDNGIETSALFPSEKVSVVNTDFSTWWVPCFAGYRGARRKKYLFSNGGTSNPVVVRESDVTVGNGTIVENEIDFVLESADIVAKWATTTYNKDSGNGSTATNLMINNTIEVELPYYRPERFTSGRIVSAQSMRCNSHKVTVSSTTPDPATIINDIAQFSTNFQQWDAVGEDFTLFFFTGCPILYSYVLNENA